MVCTVCTNCGKGQLLRPESMGLIDLNFSSIPSAPTKRAAFPTFLLALNSAFSSEHVCFFDGIQTGESPFLTTSPAVNRFSPSATYRFRNDTDAPKPSLTLPHLGLIPHSPPWSSRL